MKNCAIVVSYGSKKQAAWPFLLTQPRARRIHLDSGFWRIWYSYGLLLRVILNAASTRRLSINTEYSLLAQEFFPVEARVVCGAVSDYSHILAAEEIAFLQRAVEKRRREFSTGRFLAAKALAELGVKETVVKRGSANEPVWPAGIVGTISHDAELCVVVVARDSCSSGIGVDIEKIDASVSELLGMILRPDERGATSNPVSDAQVRLTFSAKESVYKAVYPTVQRFIDFSEVRICFDSENRTFAARSPESGELNALLLRGQGSFALTNSHLLTGFCLPVIETADN